MDSYPSRGQASEVRGGGFTPSELRVARLAGYDGTLENLEAAYVEPVAETVHLGVEMAGAHDVLRGIGHSALDSELGKTS